MSLRAELLRLGLRTFLKRRGTRDVEAWRMSMRAMERWVPRPPTESQYAEVRAGQLTFHRVVPRATRPERIVLYLHGGGYISGGPAHYRHFIWRIADALGASVWALAYRLAPEHPFPAALDDALAAYSWHAANAPDPLRLVVMGDRRAEDWRCPCC
jgi:acetyl esterase/lipase